MRNAYLIMAHHNFEQLGLLLELLDDPLNDFYIHVDAKVENLDNDKISAHVKEGTVSFTPRMSITWGGDTQIWCVMELLKASTSAYHDYYHLISGDDLPIKTNAQIAEYLEENKGRQFVGIDARGRSEDLPRYISEWIRYYWPFQNRDGRTRSVGANILFLLQRIFRVDRTKRFPGEYGKGPTWFSITDEFARYVLEREPQIHEMFANGLNCDEVFLQTIYINSPYGENAQAAGEGDNAMSLRLIDWDRGSEASPWVFTESDFEMIMDSDCLFARKFDMNVDPKIIHLIAEYLSSNK